MYTKIHLQTTMVHSGVFSVLHHDNAPKRNILNEFSLVDRVAVVTGAHRGIGLEMALALAEAGARVYCLDIHAAPDEDWKKVKAFVDALPNSGGVLKPSTLEYVSCDVTDQEGVWRCMEEIAEQEGRLDVCVACAGILRAAPCLDVLAEDVKKLMDINLNGVLYTAQGAGRQMVRLGHPGSIIIIASKSGLVANPDQPWSIYSASKAAITQLARSMACELGKHKIRVNAISPGSINTKMTQAAAVADPSLLKKVAHENPLGRLGDAEEFRGVIVWLASSASTFCTGSNIVVDGGHTAW